MNHHYTTRDIVLSPCTHDIFWFLERRKAKKNTRSEEEKIINEQQDTALVIFRSARSKRTALKRFTGKTYPRPEEIKDPPNLNTSKQKSTSGYLSFIIISYVVTNFAVKQKPDACSTTKKP